MKSKVIITAKIFNPKVHATQTGAKLYSFSMGISEQNKKTEQWENIYLPVTIFDKENRHEWILGKDKYEITIEGQLSIKPGYTKRDGTEVSSHIAVFGFEAYVGKKPERSPHPQAPEPHSIANGMNDPSPRQIEAHTRMEQKITDPLFDLQSDEIPF